MAVYFDSARKTWYCQFKYKDWTGATRSTTKRGFARKKDAVQYEIDFKNHSAESANVTLNMLAEKYLEDYKVNRKPSSYLAIRARLHEHILPSMGRLLLPDITPFRIKEWQNHLKAKSLSDSMIRSVNVAFSTLLNYAIKYFNLPANPFSKTGKTGAIRKKTNFWELDEFLKVSALFKRPEDVVVFNLLFWSGMRIGELEALTESDFDFSSNTISISKSYNPGLKILQTPKTPSAIRTITMPQAVMDAVKGFFKAFATLPQYPFQICRRETYRMRLYAYAREADVKEITLHDLRHSHASYLIHHSIASLPTIAERLGHSSAAITLATYSHMYHDSDADIAKSMNESAKSSSKVLQTNK